MTDMQEIEQAFVAEIRGVVRDLLEADQKPGIAEIDVKVSPEEPKQYLDLPGAVGAHGGILVGYDGSDFGEFLDQDTNEQPETIRINVYVLARNLREHAGAYRHLRAIKSKLNGYSFREDEAEPFRITLQRYIGRQKGLWIWLQSYEATLLNEVKEV